MSLSAPYPRLTESDPFPWITRISMYMHLVPRPHQLMTNEMVANECVGGSSIHFVTFTVVDTSPPVPSYLILRICLRRRATMTVPWAGCHRRPHPQARAALGDHLERKVSAATTGSDSGGNSSRRTNRTCRRDGPRRRWVMLAALTAMVVVVVDQRHADDGGPRVVLVER